MIETCKTTLFRLTGYQRPLDIRFHAEPGRSLSRDAVRGDASHRPPGDVELPHALALSGDQGWHIPLLTGNPLARQPQPSFEDESVSFFVQEHCVNPGPGVFRGHLDFLPDMYRSSSNDSCLRPALLAAAYISLSRHYKSSTLYVTARNHYGAALRAVNRDLSAKSNTLKDETLVSLMFLGMIEDIDCQGSSAKAVHMLGISKLYQVLGHRLIANIEASNLNGWIFTELQIPALHSEETLDCLTLPDASVASSNPAIHVAAIVARIGQFYRAAKRITSATNATSSSEKRPLLISAMEQAMGISGELAKFSGTLPSEWKPKEATDKRQTDQQDRPLVTYTSRWTASVCTRFNITLVLFFYKFSSCCRALAQLDRESGTATPETELALNYTSVADAQLKRLTHLVCISMPYLMGEVDEQGNALDVPDHKGAVMYHLVWPLGIVMASPASTNQQIEDCRARLNWIKDQYGIKLASAVPDLAKDLMA
ncbi:hypothetical protein FDECE_2278 [Fusarium decemcellulare]|nr:hypothetical protein FDECE_2278 [Fusarium decemcellulare]